MMKEEERTVEHNVIESEDFEDATFNSFDCFFYMCAENGRVNDESFDEDLIAAAFEYKFERKQPFLVFTNMPMDNFAWFFQEIQNARQTKLYNLPYPLIYPTNTSITSNNLKYPHLNYHMVNVFANSQIKPLSQENSLQPWNICPIHHLFQTFYRSEMKILDLFPSREFSLIEKANKFHASTTSIVWNKDQQNHIDKQLKSIERLG